MEMEKLTAMKNNMSKKTREKVAKAGLMVKYDSHDDGIEYDKCTRSQFQYGFYRPIY